MSSDNEAVPEFMELEEKRLVELMQKKAQSRAHSNLGESIIKKEADTKKVVASLFEKMRDGKIPEAPVTAPNAVVNRLDEGSDTHGDDAPKPQKALPPRVPDSKEKEEPLKMHAKPEPKAVKEDDFNLDTTFNEKIEEGKHDIPTESLTNPKVKDTVSKLRNMAAELRGESQVQTTQNFEKPLVVKPADGSHAPLLENVAEPSYSLKKLNSMLYRAQDKFNQTSNPVYESIADEISSVIAEAILTNKKSVPKSKISGPARKF